MKKFTKLTLLAGAMSFIGLQGMNAQSYIGDGLNGSYYRCKASTLKAWQKLAKMDAISVDVFDSTMVGRMKAPSGNEFDYNFNDPINAFKNSFPEKNDNWFAARFEGYLRAPLSGEYTINGIGDNGFRVYVNDVLVLDHWIGDWEVKVNGTAFKLSGGSYNKIKIEFAEYVGGQFLKLFWKAPGIGLDEQVIPKANLFSTIPVANSLSADYYQFSQACIDSLKAKPFNSGTLANIDVAKNLDLFNGPFIGTVPTVKNWRDGKNEFNFNFSPLWDNYLPIRGDYYSAKMEGYIKAPVTGPVTFTWWGDNGARIWIGDTLVTDHWQRDWEKDQISKPLVMKKDSLYKVKIDFFEEGGGEAFKLFWEYDGQARVFVPTTALTTHNIDAAGTLPGAYNGITPSLPGTIEAANYNTGGQFEGYFDKTPTSNSGNAGFRTFEGVDINLIKGNNVVATQTNEWLKYNVDVKFQSAYKATVTYASAAASKINIAVDGISVGTLALPANGLAVGDSTLTLNDKMFIAAGAHQITVTVVEGTPTLKSIAFGRTNSPYNGIMATIPGKVEAELYDNGGQDVAYWDTNMFHEDGGFPKFRQDEGCDNGYTFLNGNRNLTSFKTNGWNDAKEWQKYTVNVLQDGDYSVILHYSSGTNRSDVAESFFLDGTLIVDSLLAPKSTSWDLYRTVVAGYKVHMTKGVHELKSYCETGGFDFEGVTFAFPVEKIALRDSVITTNQGTVTLGNVVTPSTATNKTISWKIIGDALGATIDPVTGVLKAGGTATSNGTIKVVATANDEFGAIDTANVVITGQIISVKTLVVDPAVITVDGGNVTPTVSSLLPADAANKTLIWTIEGEAKGATIDAATGKVTASGYATGNGVIIIKAMTTDGSNVSDTTKVTITGQEGVLVGLENVNAKVSIYPNPATEYITIDGVAEGTEVRIINVAGILVKSEKLTNSTINVSDLNKGVYIVKFNGVTARIIKK